MTSQKKQSSETGPLPRARRTDRDSRILTKVRWRTPSPLYELIEAYRSTLFPSFDSQILLSPKRRVAQTRASPCRIRR